MGAALKGVHSLEFTVSVVDVSPPVAEECVSVCCEGKTCKEQDQFPEMTIDEIIHGKVRPCFTLKIIVKSL